MRAGLAPVTIKQFRLAVLHLQIKLAEPF